MKYYAVTAVCGHVGRGFYTPKTFAVKAETAREASLVARSFPRVKHDFKYAILRVLEVTREYYEWLYLANESDPFFRAFNVSSGRETYPTLERRPMYELWGNERNEDGEPKYRKGRGKVSKKAYQNRYCYNE